ncbi:MAG: hypothetical protein FWD40_06550 [Treponema sp.]|nr:hypothetical protein [Treponema sp.]
MKNKFFFLFFIAIAPLLWAQERTLSNEGLLPLRRVAIFSSGLAYYEHSGFINEPSRISVPFAINAVNDALKSLIINDSASANPSVTYMSENTLVETLRSLIIDFSDSPDLMTILSRLRGSEVIIISSDTFRGRIVNVENRPVNTDGLTEPWLLLNTSEGVMMSFNLRAISSIRFTDNAVQNDLNRALDLIAASRNRDSRLLTVNLPGSGRRNVQLSYVIPSALWKISYRLDLNAERPLFQGWAIVDNDSDTDWSNIELSLVAGRPASFIQELYPPYYVSRPVLPLAIAGAAEGTAHERAMPLSAAPDYAARQPQMMRSNQVFMNEESDDSIRTESALAGGNIQTASGSDAGGQFEFTLRNPVNLDRRMSAMLPLVESAIEARSLLIYNSSGGHPRLGAELINTTGMKLPSGPITVFDGGVYAGDALIEFWNENEKRYISFGEDLSVSASSDMTTANTAGTVNISNGVMTINRNIVFSRTYTFINSSAVLKHLVLEHRKTHQTELVTPRAFEETASVYRFNVTLPASGQTKAEVREQRVTSQTVALLSARTETLFAYTGNQEIPSNVRAALQRAAELRRSMDAADTNVRNIEAQRERLASDQDRVRRNLEAAGSQTPQGQDFLRRLVAIDSEIDALSASLERANSEARSARGAFENYLNNLNL